ncbi:MAG: class II aldolase/adducin family protein [Amphiplicatus sp.]
MLRRKKCPGSTPDTVSSGVDAKTIWMFEEAALSDRTDIEETEKLVQAAAHALARAGLVHAYGHCSARLDDSCFLVCAAGPMGLAHLGHGSLCHVNGALPEGVLGEVRVHQQIYRLRKEIRGVCRIMPPATMALSAVGVAPAPRHGIGAFLGDGPAFWQDPRLLRDDKAAAALAAAMGNSNCIVMRGNGAVTAADSLEKAVTLAWFLEDAARVEERARRLGYVDDGRLSEEEIVARNNWSGGVVERMWRYLTDASRVGSYDNNR